MTNVSQAIQVAKQANVKVQCSINNIAALPVWYMIIPLYVQYNHFDNVCVISDCYVRVFYVQDR